MCHHQKGRAFPYLGSKIHMHGGVVGALWNGTMGYDAALTNAVTVRTVPS